MVVMVRLAIPVCCLLDTHHLAVSPGVVFSRGPRSARSLPIASDTSQRSSFLTFLSYDTGFLFPDSLGEKFFCQREVVGALLF